MIPSIPGIPVPGLGRAGSGGPVPAGLVNPKTTGPRPAGALEEKDKKMEKEDLPTSSEVKVSEKETWRGMQGFQAVLPYH